MYCMQSTWSSRGWKREYTRLVNRFEGDEIVEAFKRITGRTRGIRIDLHWGYCGGMVSVRLTAGRISPNEFQWAAIGIVIWFFQYCVLWDLDELFVSHEIGHLSITLVIVCIRHYFFSTTMQNENTNIEI